MINRLRIIVSFFITVDGFYLTMKQLVEKKVFDQVKEIL
jgi:hypothetical protein